MTTQVFHVDKPKFKNYYIFCEIFESNPDENSLHEEVEFDDNDEGNNEGNPPFARIEVCGSDLAAPPGAILFNDGDTLAKLVLPKLRQLANQQNQKDGTKKK